MNADSNFNVQQPSHGRSRPRVWLCPSGKLALLPLHAAGAYTRAGLGCTDYFVPSYTPTIENLLRARSSMELPSLSETKVLLAHVPVPFRGCELPETVREMEAVREVVPKACITVTQSHSESQKPVGSGSTVTAVLRNISDTSILHIASHGFQVSPVTIPLLYLLDRQTGSQRRST